MGWPCGHDEFRAECHVCAHCRRLEARNPAYVRLFRELQHRPGEAPRLMPCKFRGPDLLGLDGRPVLKNCGLG